MNPSWLKELGDQVDVNNLPYGLKSRNAVEEMKSYETILIHHHVEPLTAFLIAQKFGTKVCWYVGEPMRAIWESHLTGMDYRQFSPTVFDTAEHFYGRVSKVALSRPIYPVTTAILRLLDRMTVRKYGSIIANSQYTANLVRKVLDFQRPIPVVYPASGLSPEMFNPDSESGESVLIVGALMPNKNHRKLFEAMAKLSDPPILRVVGEGQERTILPSLARRLGVRTEFCSYVTDIQLVEEYERSLFVVVSSFIEPFGMTAVEAAFAGKPSVVSELGGTKEFVVNGQTGLVFHPNDVTAISKALRTLVADSNLRSQMGHRALERARERFSIEQSVRSLDAALCS